MIDRINRDGIGTFLGKSEQITSFFFGFDTAQTKDRDRVPQSCDDDFLHRQIGKGQGVR